MKVDLAKSAGFCFGVRRALDIAMKIAAARKNVFMLKDIVHNEDVVKQIKSKGIKKIKRLSAVGKDKTLLISAHGAPLNIFRKARGLGYKIVDATCPMVKEIHKIAQNMEQKGCKIIIIGDKKHDEVQGITGQLEGKAIVIDGLQNIPFKELKGIKKYAVVVQSTQNYENAVNIVGMLKAHIKELRFFNTICRPTRIKQEEIKTLPQKNDAMIIIGSKTSANTRRLYEISKAINRNSYWIESKKEISRGWFRRAKNVGVTSGASTPDSTTNDVVKYIKRMTAAQ